MNSTIIITLTAILVLLGLGLAGPIFPPARITTEQRIQNATKLSYKHGDGNHHIITPSFGLSFSRAPVIKRAVAVAAAEADQEKEAEDDDEDDDKDEEEDDEEKKDEDKEEVEEEEEEEEDKEENGEEDDEEDDEEDNEEDDEEDDEEDNKKDEDEDDDDEEKEEEEEDNNGENEDKARDEEEDDEDKDNEDEDEDQSDDEDNDEDNDESEDESEDEDEDESEDEDEDDIPSEILLDMFRTNQAKEALLKEEEEENKEVAAAAEREKLRGGGLSGMTGSRPFVDLVSENPFNGPPPFTGRIGNYDPLWLQAADWIVCEKMCAAEDDLAMSRVRDRCTLCLTRGWRPNKIDWDEVDAIIRVGVANEGIAMEKQVEGLIEAHKTAGRGKDYEFLPDPEPLLE